MHYPSVIKKTRMALPAILGVYLKGYKLNFFLSDKVHNEPSSLKYKVGRVQSLSVQVEKHLKENKQLRRKATGDCLTDQMLEIDT